MYHPTGCYRSPWLPTAGLPPPESAVSPHCPSPAATGAAPVAGRRNASGNHGKTMGKPWKNHRKTRENKKTSGTFMDQDFIWGIMDHHMHLPSCFGLHP